MVQRIKRLGQMVVNYTFFSIYFSIFKRLSQKNCSKHIYIELLLCTPNYELHQICVTNERPRKNILGT